jgi:hypothetical protein
MRSIAVVVMTLVAAVASADMKPGLWEMTMKSDQLKQRSQPQQELTPAQREQMEKMGVSIPTMRDGAFVHKVCVTKEAVAQHRTPDAAPPSNECKLSNHNRSANGYRADVICDGPTIKGTGVMKGTFSGDTSFASTYEFKGTSRGKPVTQQHETSGKWLGADCGNVKPMSSGWNGAVK